MGKVDRYDNEIRDLSLKLSEAVMDWEEEALKEDKLAQDTVYIMLQALLRLMATLIYTRLRPQNQKPAVELLAGMLPNMVNHLRDTDKDRKEQKSNEQPAAETAGSWKRWQR